MYEESYKQIKQLLDDVEAYRKFRYAHKTFSKEQQDDILEYTSFIPFDCSFTTRLYYFYNQKQYLERCEICSSPILRDTTSPYKYSVSLCGCHECLVKKRKQGIIDRFGVDNVMELKHYRDKISTSNTKTPEEQAVINEKRRNTCLERYGVVNGGSTDFAQQLKRAAYNKLTLEQVEERKQKRLNTCLERYGISYPMRAEEFRKRSRAKLREYWQNSVSFNFRNIFQYDEVFFDSSYELYYYIWAIEMGKSIKRNTTKFKYTVDGVDHCYVPDFVVDGEYVEIKGSQFINEEGDWCNPFTEDSLTQKVYKEKGRCASRNGVVVMTDISEQQAYVDSKYTKDFVPLFKHDIPFPYPNINLEDTTDRGLIQHFHKSIYDAGRKGFLSPKDAWQDKSLVKKSALNRLKYTGFCTPRAVLQGFNVAKIAPKVSVFSPKKAEELIRKYISEDTIIDPFSGFSGRMLGAIRCGKTYFGRDVNETHVEESQQIVDYLGVSEEAVLECRDLFYTSEQQFPDAALFTCPPYNDKEHWNITDVDMSCDEWIEKCMEVYKCPTYLFVVDSTVKYVDNVVEEITNKSHFGTNKELVILIHRG
nr:MAG TPA: Putative modification methylase [Caudoviricetes sp.]